MLAVIALTAGGTLLPFTLFAFGQSRLSAEVAGAFLNLEPLVGAIVGAAVFGDPVGPVQIAGGAAIVAGIGLSSLPLLAGRRRPPAAPLALVAGAEPLALAAGAKPLAPVGAAPLSPAPASAPGGAGLTAHECDTLPDRSIRESHSWNTGGAAWEAKWGICGQFTGGSLVRARRATRGPDRDALGCGGGETGAPRRAGEQDPAGGWLGGHPPLSPLFFCKFAGLSRGRFLGRARPAGRAVSRRRGGRWRRGGGLAHGRRRDSSAPTVWRGR